MIKLDLGCGGRKREGFIGVDIRDYPEVDVISDATNRLPFEDNSVNEIYSYHMLEHIEKNRYARLFCELHRVCAPGAKLDFWFPYWTHWTAYDFSHVTILNEHCFEGSGFQRYFRIDRLEYTWEDEWANKPVEEREHARKHFMNVVKEMRIVFYARGTKTTQEG